MVDKIINIFVTAFLFVTAVDLLYLYFAGGWYDPSKFIEYSEVIMLVGFAIFSIFRVVVLIKRI